MKTEFFKNALELSVEELAEASKIKAQLTEIVENEIRINVVRTGFKFLEVEIYNFPKNCTFRIEEDKSTYVHTSIGIVKINNEIGEAIVKYIKAKQEKNEFINVQLMPL